MTMAARVLVVVSMVASLNCGSTTGPSGGGSGSSGATQSLSVTINNIPWTANGAIAATYSAPSGNVGTAALNVVAQDSPFTQSMSFAVSPATAGVPLAPGTYSVGATATTALLTIGSSTTFQASASAGSGSVTLTTFNTTSKTASGTFNFVMFQTTGSLTRTLTSGTFTVAFQ